MPDRNTLVDLDGELCVLFETSVQNEPTIQRIWWPTGQRTFDAVSSYGRAILEQPLEQGRWSEDGYYFKNKDMPRLVIHLKHRGRTEGIRLERVAAPLPAPIGVDFPGQ